MCVKDQYSHYPEQKTLASEGSKFAENKLVVGSDKEGGTGAEKNNKFVNTNDAKVNFNKNLILLIARIQIHKKNMCHYMSTENN